MPAWLESFVKNAAPGVAVIGVSSSHGVSSLSILTNDGSGTLSLAQTYVLPQPGSGIVAADLNGDGNLELIVTGSASASTNGSYSVLLGNGDGSFQPPVLYQQSVRPGAPLPIVIADFNGDGKVDMAVPVGNSVAVLLGNGDGTFSSPAYYFLESADSVVSADFRRRQAGHRRRGRVRSRHPAGQRRWHVPARIALGSLVPAADLNGDGNADLLGSISFGGIFPRGELQVVLGNGDGTFSALAPFPENGPYAYSTAVALADLNGDGKRDVISLDAFSLMDWPTGAVTLSHLISVY
jgi:hypothetical protein